MLVNSVFNLLSVMYHHYMSANSVFNLLSVMYHHYMLVNSVFNLLSAMYHHYMLVNSVLNLLSVMYHQGGLVAFTPHTMLNIFRADEFSVCEQRYIVFGRFLFARRGNKFHKRAPCFLKAVSGHFSWPAFLRTEVLTVLYGYYPKPTKIAGIQNIIR